MLTFQKIIFRLIQFWEKEGCIIHQGHDLETGAGTFNPATFLRCLGPEPYNAAYVEPSKRPKDGRYGENPNRVQLFHQFQVILKPSPIDVQETYLRSLQALGLNLKEHDIRFVHDDWESPTLGAYGLGWEVWVDGMEVTQFTYFQAVGSLPLKPITVEITYGLERLAMYLQNVDNLFDLKWNEQYTYGAIRKRSEIEWSIYNFSEASTKMWLHHFDDFEQEAKDLIAKNLPLPAYDFIIKASHAFNMLDARGVISVTERTGYIGRIRDLARLVATEYLTSREKEGFPLLKLQEPPPVKTRRAAKLPRRFDPYHHSQFLLEIGSEQLPASFIPLGMESLKQKMEALLKELGVSHGEIEVYGTPRRLGALVHRLPEGQASKTVERRGPSLSAIFDARGEMTAQGLGFLKAVGASSCSLEELKAGKAENLELRGDYLYAKVTEKGKSIYELLSDRLPTLILGLDFPKKMRWASFDLLYPRPIHWIVALYGEKIVPVTLGPILSDRTSYGHAQRMPGKCVLREAGEIFTALKQHQVLASPSERRAVIQQLLLLSQASLKLRVVEEERVLQEVVYLTEWPELQVAEFDPAFLKVPKEVLISEMIEHQRYFPLENQKGELVSRFLITADNTPSALIAKGNQKVLSARLNDGLFLYEQDRKIPLEKFNEKLKLITFQKELGSLMDKVFRLTSHVEILHGILGLSDLKTVSRAALLCKADLASELVGEFPHLQGIIGKYYALDQKEDRAVALAIEEHLFPKSELGSLPQTEAGVILSLADKIDNLLAYFSVGLKPTSSSDPYALRRTSLGLLKILLARERSVDLQKILEECAQSFGKKIDTQEILRFVSSRAQGLFEEKGFAKETIHACLSPLCRDPYDEFCKVQALDRFRKSSDSFAKLWEVYKRAKGQLEGEKATSFNPALATEEAEKELVTALAQMEKRWKGLLAEKAYDKAFEEMAKLQRPLARLFDEVKILTDDPSLRNNRIALLHRVFSHFVELLDFSKIKGI